MRNLAGFLAVMGFTLGGISSIASLMGVATTEGLVTTRLTVLQFILLAIFLVLWEGLK